MNEQQSDITDIVREVYKPTPASPKQYRIYSIGGQESRLDKNDIGKISYGFRVYIPGYHRK